MEEVSTISGNSPQFLFFTGGSALRPLSHFLARSHRNSIHIVTTFDSGGSTAELRRCFAIPAMGDLRNRLLALSDPALSPQVLSFMQQRLPLLGECRDLQLFLLDLARPSHPYWSNVDAPTRDVLTASLEEILTKLPPHFDLHGASVGNLILASVYLKNGRDFGPTLEFMNRFLRVRGRVLPVVDESLHLGCILEDSSCVLGQHNFKKLSRPIRSIFLTVHDPEHSEKFCPGDLCRPHVSKTAQAWIRLADLICYPMGSFFSSVLVNLLVRGVPQAIAKLSVPKVFIPNLGFDPELSGLSIAGQVRQLLALMRQDVPSAEVSDLLNYVLLDSVNGDYMGRLTARDRDTLTEMGLCVVDRPLCGDACHHDPALLIEALDACLRHGSRTTGRTYG